MSKNVWPIIFLVICILSFVSISGCTTSIYTQPNSSAEKSSVTLPDPETGLQEWMIAINAKNINRLYTLAPNQIREQVTLDQFTKDNTENYLLKPGYVFTDYTILNKTVNNTTATITAQLNLLVPSSQNLTQTQIFPISYKFFLVFEDGEWKIWNIPYS